MGLESFIQRYHFRRDSTLSHVMILSLKLLDVTGRHVVSRGAKTERQRKWGTARRKPSRE